MTDGDGLEGADEDSEAISFEFTVSDVCSTGATFSLTRLMLARSSMGITEIVSRYDSPETPSLF